MYTETVKIRGQNIDEIVGLIRNDMKTLSFNPVEEVHVFMSERYYLRNNAQLMTCLIVKIEDEENCIINIVSGGGSTGMFAIDYGAEGSRNKEVKTMLAEICMDRDWTLEE